MRSRVLELLCVIWGFIKWLIYETNVLVGMA